MRNPFMFEVEPFEIGGYEQESWEVAKAGGGKPGAVKLDCKKIVLNNFARSEYALRMWHYEKLLAVGLSLPVPVLVIRGHTDTSGNDTPNLGLSLSRAFEVLQWLRLFMRDKPVAPTLIVEGLGETELEAKPERTPADAARNRRVEILLCKGAPPPAPTGPVAKVRRLVLSGRVA